MLDCSSRFHDIAPVLEILGTEIRSWVLEVKSKLFSYTLELVISIIFKLSTDEQHIGGGGCALRCRPAAARKLFICSGLMVMLVMFSNIKRDFLWIVVWLL